MFNKLENSGVNPGTANAQQAPPVNTAPPQPSPLDNLRDIHLPDSIDQFPSAIGWWILLVIVLFILSFIIFKIIKKHKALRFLRTAKLELNLLSQQPANNESLSQLSALLKRISLIYYPSSIIASLSGRAWWDFLNNEIGENIYSEDDITRMSQSRYQKNATFDKDEYSKLVAKTEKCVELIVRKAIKKKFKYRSVQNQDFVRGVEE